MKFSNLPPDIVEARRKQSVAAMGEKQSEHFRAKYQEHCDRLYWTKGQCCAGCDHWQSAGVKSGECTAAGLVSGHQVLKSIGVTFSSYTPPPGFPYTDEHFHCGKFIDNFDWSTLPADYLHQIGAMKNGVMKQKPKHKSPATFR